MPAEPENPNESPQEVTPPESNPESSVQTRNTHSGRAKQKRDQGIVAMKVAGHSIPEIAERYPPLSEASIYQILRENGIGLRGERHECVDCLRELEQGILFNREEVRYAMVKDRCLKHYQRFYRESDDLAVEKRQEMVDVTLPDGTVQTMTRRQYRLLKRREAQQRYTDRNPGRVKQIIEKHRLSDRGRRRAANKSSRYLEKKRIELYRALFFEWRSYYSCSEPQPLGVGSLLRMEAVDIFALMRQKYGSLP